MGQIIILDSNEDDGHNLDNITTLDIKLQKELINFDKKAQSLINELKSGHQNHLSRDYYQNEASNKFLRYIIRENSSPKDVAKIERDFKMLLQDYVKEKEAQHALNLFKDKKRRVEYYQEPDASFGLNFKYLPGHLGSIVLLRYYIFHTNVVLPKSQVSLLLFCFSIEVFDKTKIPLCFMININSMIKRQEEEIYQRQEQQKENGSISALLKETQSITIEELVNKLKAENKIMVIPFVKPLPSN